MSLKEGKAEIFLGGFFALFGVIFLTLVIPSQIKYIDGAFPQPRFFPNLICALITVLGAALCIQGIRKYKKDPEGQEVYEFKWKEEKLVLLTLGILIAYVGLLYFVPYLPATIIATGVLVALYGQKSIVKILLTAIIVPTIIYVGMTYGLKVNLP